MPARPLIPASASPRLGRLCAVAALTVLLVAVGCKPKKQAGGKPVAAPNTSKYAGTLNPLIASKKLDFLRWPDISDLQPALQAFYNNRELELAWSRDGRPTSQATALMIALEEAAGKGLRPEDYDGPRWTERVNRLASGDNNAIAQFDVALTLCTMRFVSDLHMGRVPPQHFNFEIDRDSKRLDLPQFLNDKLLEASDIPGVLASLEPDSDDYRKTRDALHRYQELATQMVGFSDPLPPVSGNLSPGDHYAGIVGLEHRLTLEGDGSFPMYGLAGTGSSSSDHAADPGTRKAPTRLSQADSDAIKAWQSRHGISPDGKLGAVTVRSLNVPMATRVQQLSDALERWRWLPEPYLHPRLLVNLPEFLLRGYTPDHQLDFTMRVVVGQAKDNHDTPVFTHMMKYVIFRPFWNVPVSIIKKELVPHVAANPGYLEEKNYEVLGRSGKPVTAYTANGLEHGMFLVREKPGPGNSLGLIKFMFPNQYDIYLHSTPAVSLFSRQRRDFSHGCVRVQHPDQLAVWVLDGQKDKGEDWDLEHVQAAMNDGDDNRQVSLRTQLPIVIFYVTAHVDADAKVDFFDDIYGYDKDLDETLQKGPPYPSKPAPTALKSTPGDTV